MDAMTAPQSIPSPRGAHLEMVGAVLAGDGVEKEAIEKLRAALMEVEAPKDQLVRLGL